VRPRINHYWEESGQIMQIVAQTGAVVEPMSVNEAYLDVSAISQAEHNDASLLKAMPLARHLKQRILPTPTQNDSTLPYSWPCNAVFANDNHPVFANDRVRRHITRAVCRMYGNTKD
jgi:hypothetical protein